MTLTSKHENDSNYYYYIMHKNPLEKAKGRLLVEKYGKITGRYFYDFAIVHNVVIVIRVIFMFRC